MIPSDLQDAQHNGAFGPVIEWPLIAIHAMVLPDGRMVSFGTTESGVQSAEFVYAVWDWRTNGSILLPQTTSTDMFCSNMALDPYIDQVLVVGGDFGSASMPGEGVRDVNMIDPLTLTIAPSPTGPMASPRWYPTVLTLGSGDILTLGGREDHPAASGGNETVEIYRSGVGWHTLADVSLPLSGPGSKWWYPSAFQRSDGEVVMIEGSSAGDGADIFAIGVEGTGSLEHLGVLPFRIGSGQPSVLYRTDKVLMADIRGGLWSVDIAGDTPTFQKVADLGGVRVDSDFVLIADGRVLIEGGAASRNDLATAEQTLAVYDPDTGELTMLEDEALARLYHSSALLLPDGTVALMGGGAPGPLVNTNAQIFAPDYLFGADGTLADRPEATLVADRALQAGGHFLLHVDDTADLGALTALKSGASTHSKNADARFLELDYTVLDDHTVEVRLPDNPNILTPGTFMLFAFDEAGTPSNAAMLEVDPGRMNAPYAFGTSTYRLGTAGLTLAEARTEAAALGGHLVTISGKAEKAFLQETFDHAMWTGRGTGEKQSLAFDKESPDGAILTVIEFDASREIVAQTGTRALRGNGSWVSVSFDHAMVDPVVVLSPPTYNGEQPVTVNVRNVGANGFQMQIDHWDYDGGSHKREMISWLAVERGVHTLCDGAVIEAGSVCAGTADANVDLGGDFGGMAPVVLSQRASILGSGAATDRVSEVSDRGFSVRLQEEEAARPGHLKEEIDWIALMRGNHDAFAAFLGDVDDGGTTVRPASSSGGPRFFAEIQSDNEADPATLRITGRSADEISLFAQEERSFDDETHHLGEALGWAALDETIFA